MKTNIVKIEGNKIQVVIDNDVKEFELEVWVKPDFVSLGEAEITVTGDKVSFVKMLNSSAKSSEKSDEKSWADDMTNFGDLLAAAHKKFTKGFDIRTEILRDGQGNLMLDFQKKMCVVKATVDLRSEEGLILGQTFEAHGDATEGNIKGDLIKPHFIRMAETRAISRALRWATNNAKVAEEETTDVYQSGGDASTGTTTAN